MPHFFYLARCRDGSLYAGTCVDLLGREAKHNEGTGAKYTRSRLPVKIVYHEQFRTLGAARRREALIKRWSKTQKKDLIRVSCRAPAPRTATRTRSPRRSAT